MEEKMEKTASGQQETLYAREQLIRSERYQNRRDLVAALVPEGTSMSLRELDEKIEKYMKGQVK